MSDILVVGSLAYDSISTPAGKADRTLGGSANYFSLAASLFAPVKIVGVVGEDFPQSQFEALQKRGVDTKGIQQVPGKTFHWTGEYGTDLNEAKTLSTQLNVFEHFNPKIPENYAAAEYVFLGNGTPPASESEAWEAMRAEFLYWYPVDFRNSGKDLIQRLFQKFAITKAIYSLIFAAVMNPKIHHTR